MSGQATHDGDAVLSEDTLTQYIAEWRWSPSEVADEFDVAVSDVKDAIHVHNIDYDRHSLGAKASGAAKILWEMDADDFPPEDDGTSTTPPEESDHGPCEAAYTNSTLGQFSGGESA